jgi:hypothetical protein
MESEIKALLKPHEELLQRQSSPSEKRNMITIEMALIGELQK